MKNKTVIPVSELSKFRKTENSGKKKMEVI